MTVNLDPDVEALIRAAMKKRGLSFNAALNSALRAGLTCGTKKHGFTQRTFALGAAENFRWDKALETSALLEDDELTRRLALGK
jgi:hypothetical protein